MAWGMCSGCCVSTMYVVVMKTEPGCNSIGVI